MVLSSMGWRQANSFIDSPAAAQIALSSLAQSRTSTLIRGLKGFSLASGLRSIPDTAPSSPPNGRLHAPFH
jgi:hypothetical protein